MFWLISKNSVSIFDIKNTFFFISIKYLVFIFYQDGCWSDLENIAIIQCMIPQFDVSCLCTFLDLVSHYGNFFHHYNKWNHQSIDCQQKIPNGPGLVTVSSLLKKANPCSVQIYSSHIFDPTQGNSCSSAGPQVGREFGYFILIC